MRKILFLDRDGIINIDKGYLYKPEDVEFVDGIINLLKTAKRYKYEFIVVTNQAGVARGMYTQEDVVKLHTYMKSLLSAEGIEILDFFYCPHHPDFSGECDCRKPAPGMILQAIKRYETDLSKSFMIGDKRSDVQAGKNAGVGKCILVSGRYESTSVPEADLFAKDLHEAADFIEEYCEA